MVPARIPVVAVLVAAAAATGYGYQIQSSQANRPWPPDVQKVAAESPVLTPAEALKTFYMPPGYRLELVASEPLIRDPVAIDWDPDGRLWAVEMPGFVRNLSVPEPNLDPIGRIVVLEDKNGDGVMDKRTIFADGLELARALKVLDHGVLVGEPPNVWLMHDTDGDLKMDRKEKVTDLYGRREGRVEQNANMFHWSLDNWMYTANSDMLLRWKNGAFEVRKTLSRGEWGATHDDAGRVYRNVNSSALHVDFVPTAYYARNPLLQRTRGSYESIGDSSANIVWPVRPNPGTNRAYQFGIDRPDGTLEDFTSVCAPEVYRGDRLPSELYGSVFVAEPAANLVSRLVLTDDGTTLRASKAYERGEFIASTDERFRPVFLSTGPDGTLYVVDMYRGVVQQRADITEYLRDHIVKYKLEEGIELGRIYRVMHETTRPDAAPVLTKATPAQLVETLSHPNGWRRDTAQRLLVERGDKAAVPALRNLAATANEPRTRLHALWTLDGMDAIEADLVTRALDDASRDVRASAVRLAERWLGNAAHPMQTVVLARIDDPDWTVRQQLAASLGALPVGKRETALVSLLEKHAADPIVMDAALSGVRGSEAALLEKLLQGSGGQAAQASAAPSQPQREAAITMVASLIVRGAQDAAIQNLFASIGDESRPAWQRSALMRGAEIALNVAGAQMPGTGRRGGAAGAAAPGGAASAPATASPAPAITPPCPTCPGGRGGPGGA